MYTHLLMRLSAAFLAVLGVLTTFLPQELLRYLGTTPDPAAVIVVQLAGALYLGYAMLNWMARDFTIGGIYNRPLAMANFLHFIVAGLALARFVAGGQTAWPWLAVTGGYVVLSIWFALVLFTHPGRKTVPVG